VSYLLDTNICSAHLRRPAGLVHRFIQHGGRLATATVVLAELYDWAHGRDDPVPFLRRIDELLQDLNVIPFDRECAEQFGRLRASLRRQGVGINPIDLMIASTALAYDLTLVTHNTGDFERIPDLRLEDWLTR